MPALSFSNLSYVLPDGTTVLPPIDGAFSAGTTGLIGRNGTGKTTLVSILAGRLAATSGSFTASGSVAMLRQRTPAGHGSVADALGIGGVLRALDALEAGDASEAVFEVIGDRWDAAASALEALAALGMHAEPSLLSRDAVSLSGGEAMLVALARIRLAGADIVVLDEPSNNLDRAARGALIDAIATWRGTLVVVSHDRELLDRVDRIAELSQQGLRTFEGPYASYESAIAVEQEAAARDVRDAEQRLRKEKRERIAANEQRQRAEAAGRRAERRGGIPKIMAHGLRGMAEATSARSRAMHARREGEAGEALEAATSRVRDDRAIRIQLPATRVPSGRDVLRLQQAGTEFVVRGAERIALSGPNGAGKSTLFSEIVTPGAEHGVAPVATTAYRIAELRILTQGLHVPDEDASLIEAVRAAAPSRSQEEIRGQLASFLFRGARVETPVRALSGGERFRLALARVLLAEPAPQLLLLDEPTNNLDMESTAQLVQALGAYEGALIVISHDERVVAELGLTRRWTIEDGSLRDAQFEPST